MEARRRHHPHSRKEWHAIRSIVTDLYQAQGKKLSEVVEILGEHGFHARQCHYKTYIKKWGLDRNNKQSDMIFARQKLQERQEKGKETVFIVRGQKRTLHDVERYWKRKCLDPEEFPTVANTPNGMDYRTPSPNVETHSLGAEADQNVLEEYGSPSDASQATQLARRNCQHLSLALQTSTLHMLTSPDALRAQERALHCAKLYFHVCITHLSSEVDLGSLRESHDTLALFTRAAGNALAAIESGQPRVNVLATQADLLDLLPSVVMSNDPYLIASLLDSIGRFLKSSRGSSSWLKRLAIYELIHRLGQACDQTRPLPTILHTVLQCPDDAVTLSEMVLVVGKEALARDLDRDRRDTQSVLRYLCAVSYAFKDHCAALAFAQRLYSLDLREAAATTVISQTHLLESQKRLIWCHINLRNYGEAERLVGRALASCSDLEASALRNFHRSELLYQQGLLKAHFGQAFAAIESLSEALGLILRVFGAGDFLAYQIARDLERIQCNIGTWELDDLHFDDGLGLDFPTQYSQTIDGRLTNSLAAEMHGHAGGRGGT